MSEKTFDLTVIGAGPAGYVAAIKAAQLGMNVALVEARAALGGTCLNVGCIPSKALLDSSEKFEMAGHHFKDHGIEVAAPKLNLAQMLSRKDDVVKKLTQGIAFLMKKNKVTVVNGWGRLTGPGTVNVEKDGNTETLKSKNILIAAGSVPVELPFARFDGETVVSSTEALAFDKVPEHLIVIGAGVIGLEMGSVWRRLGAKVTLVDIAPVPLAIMDKDLGTEALKLFTRQGLQFKLSSKVESIEVTGGKAKVALQGPEGGETLEGDKVLVAVGRRPNTRDLGLDTAGVETDDRGFIKVDRHYKTSVDGIYAVGDCTPGPMLAHKGEEEGIACVERLAGQAGHVNYDAIPWVVYTVPEVAGVGLTQQQAEEAGREVKTGKFAYQANGRALAVGETDGFVKVIADKKTDKLLGVHIIGFNASEMISEAVVAMEFGASAEDLARTVHAHPTLSEVTKEAALAVGPGPIHG